MTGSANGLGKAIALQLATDGFDVALADLESTQASADAVADEIRAMGRRALVVTGDVTIEQDVVKMVNKVVEVLGGVDVVRQSLHLRN